MSSLLEWKKKLQTIYAQYSMYIDKAIRFMLALTTFLLISTRIGFMEKLASPIIATGLAVICTFLPLNVTVIIAGALILVHMFSLSVIIAGVTAVVLFLMFIFYFRFTPKKAVILLLTPIAFTVKIPVLIPVVFGLIGNPVYAIPAAFGTVVYYLVKFTKEYAGAMGNAGKESMINIAIGFVKQVMTNKEMWFVVAAVVVSLLVVYLVRRLPIDYAWAIGSVAGAVAYIAVSVTGNVMFDTGISYVTLVLGAVLATAIGLGLELMIFSVDYSRTENVQFEDDEYYYYVKAVPKLSVPAKEKQVKRINKRQEAEQKEDETTRQKEELDDSTPKMQLTGEMDIDKLIEKELMK